MNPNEDVTIRERLGSMLRAPVRPDPFEVASGKADKLQQPDGNHGRDYHRAMQENSRRFAKLKRARPSYFIRLGDGGSESHSTLRRLVKHFRGGTLIEQVSFAGSRKELKRLIARMRRDTQGKWRYPADIDVLPLTEQEAS